MKKCDPRVYAKCPDRSLCGDFSSAIFTEGSPCDLYNERMLAEPATNADRIRTMSNDELANVLSSPCLGCVVKGCKLHNYGSYGCEKAFLKWLQQPAKEYISEDIKTEKYISKDIGEENEA